MITLSFIVGSELDVFRRFIIAAFIVFVCIPLTAVERYYGISAGYAYSSHATGKCTSTGPSTDDYSYGSVRAPFAQLYGGIAFRQWNMLRRCGAFAEYDYVMMDASNAHAWLAGLEVKGLYVLKIQGALGIINFDHEIPVDPNNASEKSITTGFFRSYLAIGPEFDLFDKNHLGCGVRWTGTGAFGFFMRETDYFVSISRDW